jgi:hypothetical protein
MVYASMLAKGDGWRGGLADGEGIVSVNCNRTLTTSSDLVVSAMPRFDESPNTAGSAEALVLALG